MKSLIITLSDQQAIEMGIISNNWYSSICPINSSRDLTLKFYRQNQREKLPQLKINLLTKYAGKWVTLKNFS